MLVFLFYDLSGDAAGCWLAVFYANAQKEGESSVVKLVCT